MATNHGITRQQRRIHQEIEKAIRSKKLPSDPAKQELLLSNLNGWISSGKKSLSILVTGKTGSGKSTLLNGILGDDTDHKAEEGRSLKEGHTKTVESYKSEKNGVTVTVYDSPGLQDGTSDLDQQKYLEQVENECGKKCSNVDIILYCTSMSETRFVQGTDNPDVVAMKKFTEKFGEEFWQKAVLVLTYANVFESMLKDQHGDSVWDSLSVDKKAKKFNEKIKWEWEDQVKNILMNNIKISEETTNSIQFIPAGHYNKFHLPGQKYWLSHLWFQCCFTMHVEKRDALWQVTTGRFISVKDVEKINVSKLPIEKQPIVVADETVKKRHAVRNGAVIGAIGAAGVGAIIGGIIGGPIGIAAGAGIGTFFGITLGATTGRVYTYARYRE